ncbi:type III-A CRISPR-associated RAMP protein Csm5 [Desulfoscipio gibsoniae]
MKYGHLERLELTLRALSPVFIGSGEKLSKKEYILDPQKGMIYFPNLFRLMGYLKQQDLLSAYEIFLIRPGQNDLHAFLQASRIPENDYAAFVNYAIPAGEAVRAANFREVRTFIKDNEGRPYIPGSSVKGALRTALAVQLIKTANGDRLRRSVLSADDAQSARKYLFRESEGLEKDLFCRLGITDPRGKTNLSRQPVNDLMRGIQISDSTSLSFDRMTLAGKYDRKPDGTINLLPIFRECLVPGSEAHLLMTLDTPILKKAGVDVRTIENALHSFADEHYANFEQFYDESTDDAPVVAQQGVDIILGGGAGYVSKTLVYNLFPKREEALPLVAKIMHKQFGKHGHMKDAQVYKVSPHTLKISRYKNQYYQMGRCELIIK